MVIERIYRLSGGQYIFYEDIRPNIVSRRRNLNGTLLRSSMVITNNDSLNHLNDYT